MCPSRNGRFRFRPSRSNFAAAGVVTARIAKLRERRPGPKEAISGWTLDDVMAGRPNSRLGSIIHTKFVENVNDMTFDCMRTDGKDIGYFVIGGSFSYKAKHLNLTICKICLNFNLIIFMKNLLFLLKIT